MPQQLQPPTVDRLPVQQQFPFYSAAALPSSRLEPTPLESIQTEAEDLSLTDLTRQVFQHHGSTAELVQRIIEVTQAIQASCP